MESKYTKQEIAKYIIWKYQKEYKENITPFKLQASMYLLSCFWEEKVLEDKVNRRKDKYFDKEMDFSDEPIKLCDAMFENCRYGKVEREIYEEYGYEEKKLKGEMIKIKKKTS